MFCLLLLDALDISCGHPSRVLSGLQLRCMSLFTAGLHCWKLPGHSHLPFCTSHPLRSRYKPLVVMVQPLYFWGVCMGRVDTQQQSWRHIGSRPLITCTYMCAENIALSLFPPHALYKGTQLIPGKITMTFSCSQAEYLLMIVCFPSSNRYS